MLRERDLEMLDGWPEEASASRSPELCSFAAKASARGPQGRTGGALFCESRSNGQVEGQIDRLKLLKRQTYGGAKLDVLKRRAVGAAA